IKAAAAGTNQLTVVFSGTPANPDIRYLEYSGINTINVLDACCASGTGSSASFSITGPAVSTNNDLLVGGVTAWSGYSSGSVNAGWTERLVSQHLSGTFDQFPATTGTYTLSGSLASSGAWVAQYIALKGSASAPPPNTHTLTVPITGDGTVVSSPAGINCTQSVTGTSGTCSAPFVSGTTVNLTATVATGTSFTGWTVDGTALPNLGTTVSVGMSVDHTVAAGFTFSLASQEPITVVASPASLFAKKLPADVMSHLAPNSDVVAQQALAACKSSPTFACTTATIWAHSGSSNDINGIPRFYGNPTDPWYVIPGGPSPPNSNYNDINVPFQCPNQAQTSGASSEEYFSCWDQTQNKTFMFYKFTGGSGSQTKILPNCVGSSKTSPCSIGFSPSDSMMAPFNDPQGYGAGGSNPWSSADIFPTLGMIRVQELIQGHIFHPLLMNVLCEAPLSAGSNVGGAVFPDTTGFGAGSCNLICPSGSSTCSNISSPPVSGNLLFLDYTATDLALLKGYLPKWQYPIIEAMTNYGGYISDTGNPLHPSRVENDDAYKVAGITNPLWNWLNGQPGTNAGCGTGTTQCTLNWNQYNGTYGACPTGGSANLCDIT